MSSEMMANESKPSASDSHQQYSKFLGSKLPSHPIPPASISVPEVKKSRFSVSSHAVFTQGTNVKGFVRSAATLSSVSQDARLQSSAPADQNGTTTKKQSRWDT